MCWAPASAISSFLLLAWRRIQRQEALALQPDGVGAGRTKQGLLGHPRRVTGQALGPPGDFVSTPPASPLGVPHGAATFVGTCSGDKLDCVAEVAVPEVPEGGEDIGGIWEAGRA